MKLSDCQKGMRVKVARPPADKPHLLGWQGRIVQVPDKPEAGAWRVHVKFLNGVASITPGYLEECHG